MLVRMSFLKLFVFFAFAGFCQSPSDVYDYKNYDEITWLGVDFSHLKIIGDFDSFSGKSVETPQQFRDSLYIAWNELFISEPKKYDLKGMLKRKDINISIDVMNYHNKNSDLKDLVVSSTPEYKTEDIQQFINTIPFTKNGGVGILFVAESFKKKTNKAIWHLVAININTKKVLVHEVYKADAGGCGLKNFWAYTLYKSIGKAKSNFTKYKKKYSK